MAYQAPYIDAAGLRIPSYTDILADLIAQAQSIFGADIYLGNDSMDYQLLSVVALKISDAFQSVQLAYNSRSPVTAIGSSLDAIVKMNGLTRKIPSYSTCQVTLTGTAGAVITNGIIQDVGGNKWDLPQSVTIGSGGTVTVTATCEVIGAITALNGDINSIVTPTKGWTSIINSVVAVAGQPVETDSQFRTRQAVSSALPSSTLFIGTIAAISALEGVTRQQCYENPTGSTDGNGVPAHSISCVVEGSTDALVAAAIYNNKSVGCGTYGSTNITVNDPNQPGISATINFYRPTYVPIYMTLSIHQLAGYTTATTAAISAAVTNYLNTLGIGESLTISGLYAAAMSVAGNISIPLFSVRSLTAGSTFSGQAGTDISIAFNGVAQGLTGNDGSSHAYVTMGFV